MSFTFEEYVHNYAIWTAARAVQRGFVSTEIISKGIKNSGLQKQLKNLKARRLTSPAYDKWHLGFYLNFRKSFKGSISYGRYAKIVAIYIKTSEVLRNPTSNLAKFAHPPVDRKLLSEIMACKQFTGKKFECLKSSWTKLKEKKYFEVIDALREIQKQSKMPYFWMIEEYWKAA